MDYVVFGIGFGATILVLGLLLRDFGPRLRFRASRDGGEVLSAEELVGKVSWARFCTALGSVLALAGAVFLLITLVSMVLVVSDDTGLWVMAVAYGLLLIIIAYWTWAYFHRFGSYGILPERTEPEPVAPRYKERAQAQEDEYAGPPLPWADDDADDLDVSDDEPGEAEIVDTEDEDEAVTDADVDEPDEDAGEEAEEADGEGVTDAPTASRLETPEERLAHAESPIDHGSAEGDLDLAASGPRRPGGFAGRRPNPAMPTEGDDTEPEQEDDRDRA